MDRAAAALPRRRALSLKKQGRSSRAGVRDVLGSRGGRDLVVHLDHGLPGLPHAIEDILVLDAQLGVIGGVVAYLGAEDVVLP